MYHLKLKTHTDVSHVSSNPFPSCSYLRLGFWQWLDISHKHKAVGQFCCVNCYPLRATITFHNAIYDAAQSNPTISECSCLTARMVHTLQVCRKTGTCKSLTHSSRRMKIASFQFWKIASFQFWKILPFSEALCPTFPSQFFSLCRVHSALTPKAKTTTSTLNIR